jgi:hypothetical protein
MITGKVAEILDGTALRCMGMKEKIGYEAVC